MKKMVNYQYYIFDLDDTLIYCGKYYSNAKKKFVERKMKTTGLSEEICLEVLSSIDINSTKTEHGFGKTRLPKSFYATSIALDIISGKDENIEEAKELEAVAESVFDAPYEEIPGALDTVKCLKDMNKKIYLLTKGDEDIQRRKFEIHGLFDLIGEDNMRVVPRKSSEVLATFMQDKQIPMNGSTVVVGDSVRDDIRSSQLLNIDNIRVLVDTDAAWKPYENIAVDSTFVVRRVQDILYSNATY